MLRFVPTAEGKTYWHDDADRYWRVMVFIPRAKTFEAVNPEYSYYAGKAFGHFEAMLVDLDEPLGETIPDFHNMELRMRQLRDAVAQDPVGRLAEVKDMVDELETHAEEMCKAEQMGRDGVLPKRICHCDTKVNNMMFDEDGRVLCVIDLDTVMPSFVFSDYGDFLRTGANAVAEDDPAIERVAFRRDIFEAFTRGYLESATFLTSAERDNLPYLRGILSARHRPCGLYETLPWGHRDNRQPSLRSRWAGTPLPGRRAVPEHPRHEPRWWLSSLH